ncbi:MAG TPA: class 1 fructose-bisphosphatase [Gemmatales bacterium]|nr:class 1 fructose-bisphosphatase [Gemmatales bacterium]
MDFKPHPLMTVQQHILEEQRRRAPGATGEFSWLLSGLTLATKMIDAQVRRAGLVDILGGIGGENVQGEAVQKLDVFSNEALHYCFGNRGSVAIIASEEDVDPMVIERDLPHGKYIVVYDPLDGSSNIDVNVSVGTIFSVLQRDPANPKPGGPTAEVLQPGLRQLAAGYVVYGSSTMLVYTTGTGVHGFTLDPSIGAYVISHPEIKMPKQGSYYSCNEAKSDTFPEAYRQFLSRLRAGEGGRDYSTRYVGSLVADFHRTLLKGGIFLYPPTRSHPKGKLRLMYEANPIAFLAEQAGGMATDGVNRILEIEPTSLHERTPLVVGSPTEVSLLREMLLAAG